MDIETKICTRCGVEKPIEKFRINKLKGQNPYRISVCQQCRYRIRKERKNSLSENIDVKIPRQFKKIVPEKVLDVTCYGIDLIEEDEVFMEKADCINFWISNYGRAVQKTEVEKILDEATSLSTAKDIYEFLKNTNKPELESLVYELKIISKQEAVFGDNNKDEAIETINKMISKL